MAFLINVNLCFSQTHKVYYVVRPTEQILLDAVFQN